MRLRRLNDAAGQPQPRPLPETLADLRTKAVLNGAAAVGVLVGVGVLADQTGYVEVAWFGLVAILPALRAVWLWQDTSREALRLPQRPERKTPPHWLRVWWWLRSRPPRVKARPMPYRPVKVGDDAEVRMPRQPGEMRQETEQIVVAYGKGGYTASDVYFVVCRAASVGLSDRNWQFGEGERLTLPSGAPLTRDGFRAIQAWLVQRGHAAAKPAYALTTTPEAILETL